MRFLTRLSARPGARRLAVFLCTALAPGLAAAQACPDINGPTLQNISFNAAQLAMPQSMQMVAGGDLNLANCPTVPGEGFVVAGPDYELQLTGVAPGSALVLRVQGNGCDTVLLANDFSGAWQFNDDGPSSFDPELAFPVQDGIYDIWVGTWQPQTCNAVFSLQIVPGGMLQGQFGQPGMPGQPGTPGQPGQFGAPGQPGMFGQPQMPGQPGMPQQQGGLAGMLGGLLNGQPPGGQQPGGLPQMPGQPGAPMAPPLQPSPMTMGCPDPNQTGGAPVTATAAQLAQGQRLDIVAGGDLDLSACAAQFGLPTAGFAVAYPDFELTLTGATPGAELTLYAEAQCDLVLLVNDATGAWAYNDDAQGSNPALTLPARDGMYDIWVGTYGTELCQGQLSMQVSGAAAPTTTPGGKPSTLPQVQPMPQVQPQPQVQPAAQALPDPGNLVGFRSSEGQTLTFSVTGSDNGRIWGSGPYTDDSRLAVAAVHAGVLQPGQSGPVTVRILGAQPGFAASTANGVESATYGAWSGSFDFVR